MEEYERFERINTISTEIVKEMLLDRTKYEESQLREMVEYLARSVIDLTSLQTNNQQDISTTLKATLCKVRIAYNSLKKRETVKQS